MLFQAFLKDREDSDFNAYSGVNEEILKRIKEEFADLDNVYLYEQVGDVLCFLEKSDTLEEMGTNINRGIGRITDIMKDFEDWIYFISCGKSVERIRDVNNSYRDASRRFADRYMLDESCIILGNDDTPQRQRKIRETIEAEKKDSAQDMDLGNIDIRRLDISGIDFKMLSQKTILHFLRSGTLSEVGDLVNEYFNSIGEDAMGSIMFRQYILMESLLSGLTFLDSMGVGRDKASDILGELKDPIKFVENLDSSKEYIRLLLNSMIEYRNQISDKKYLEIIEKAKKFIQDEYRNEDMSLQLVASNVNVSSNHFSAIFRKETGETFIDYLTRVRMENAKELLTCTSMKTSEIGFEVGYRDPHYFSYIFKKTIGMSPKEYRRTKK